MATTKLVTAEDLLLMDQDKGRYELIEGELRERPPAGEEHGEIGLGIAARIWLHVREHQLGTVYNSETGFVLARDPDVLVAPDVAFIRSGRLPEDRDKQKFIETAPDLFDEGVSPSEQPGDITNKVQRYLDADVQLVWIVYPRQRTVAVFKADRTWDNLQSDAELDGGDVLPGFKLPLAELFGEKS